MISESSDLYLVKKNNKVWCAAHGETAYSALSWSTSNITDVYKEGKLCYSYDSFS